MLFHNPSFLFFFLPIVFFFFFLIFKKKNLYQKYLLILASFIFYAAWNIKFSFLIITTILVNYFFGVRIIKSKKNKFNFLLIAVLFNIIFLAIFKYMDFIITNLNYLFNLNINLLNLPFPLALSFVTFQTIAFLVDCYDGNIIKTNLKKYALFISFFPQLIAGPIVRYSHMINQFEDQNNSSINYKNIYIGLIIISIGLIKKVLIADNISVFVDQGFASNHELTFFEGWLTSLGFTFQIYFDFSGYIDMATGIALLFNISLPANFNSPFKATGMIDFWQRWHITLSKFLTNYIYYPLSKSFNNLTFTKSMLVTMIVFIIAGLWHGPSWLFVVFGALHGLGLIVNQAYKKFFSIKLNKLFSQFLTFNYVSFSLIFFRAQDFESAFAIIKAMTDLSNFTNTILISIPNNSLLAFILAFIVCFMFKNTGYIIDKLKK